MIDDFPLIEAVEGFTVAMLALATARTQQESIRRPLVAVVAVALTVAWAFDLAPGRLALVGIGALALSLSTDVELRFLGGFVAIAALATTMPPSLDASWRMAALVVVGSVALLLVGRLDALLASVVVLAAAMVGGFLALPDTERVAFVGGVVGAVLLATLVMRPVSATTTGLMQLGAMVVWAGAVDSRGRPPSFVSVVAPLSLLAALALAGRWSRRPPFVVLAIAAAGLAVYAGRVAGLRTDTAEAVELASVAAVVASAVVVASAFVRPKVSD